jgi:hypothetical protein
LYSEKASAIFHVQFSPLTVSKISTPRISATPVPEAVGSGKSQLSIVRNSEDYDLKEKR